MAEWTRVQQLQQQQSFQPVGDLEVTEVHPRVRPGADLFFDVVLREVVVDNGCGLEVVPQLFLEPLPTCNM